MSAPSAELLSACIRCGAVVPNGVSGCHAIFGEILAREYRDPAYGAVNHLTVDAHALQHPEDHGLKNNPFHLLRLCWIVEYGGDPRIGSGPRWLHAPFEGLPSLPDLAPPVQRGDVTVVDVAGTQTPAEHAARVTRWARAVWAAWHTHHTWARLWIGEHGPIHNR